MEKHKIYESSSSSEIVNVCEREIEEKNKMIEVLISQKFHHLLHTEKLMWKWK
jgi:hypothetical protein